MVTKLHIGQLVDLWNEFTAQPVRLLSFQRRGQFDLALIRTASGTEWFVERAELYPRQQPPSETNNTP